MKALKELLGLRRRTNTLTPGKLADLAVLSQDIFKVPPPDLSKTESVLPVVGGKIIYDPDALGLRPHYFGNKIEGHFTPLFTITETRVRFPSPASY
jgi:Amidohydrolase family